MAWLLSRISSLRIDGDVLTAGESVSKRSAARACASWPADGPWVLQMNRDDNGPKSLVRRAIMPQAGVAKLADARDLKSRDSQRVVRVRFPPPAPAFARPRPDHPSVELRLGKPVSVPSA